MKNTNPAGNPKVRKIGVHPPAPDVAAKQSAKHSEADFARDLAKATRRKPAAS
jgi:hypothetical protein